MKMYASQPHHLSFLVAFFIITSAFAQPPDSTLRELPDQRTYFSKTYYNARDNTFTTRISPGYVHYLASDGTYQDIDTNLRLDKSGAYYIIDNGLYNVAFTGNFSKGNWDVAYEVPRPVKEKFRDPGKARRPVTRMRWKVLSYGYWDAQENRYRILEEAKSVTPVVSGNVISYLQIFSDIDIHYICGNVGVKEEIVLSQLGRNNLPDPAQYGLSRANTYFVVAMEFFLTPANINAFARRLNGKTPIKQGNNFGFDGDDPIDFEDADSTLHFFFPKDYAYAAADSVTDFSNRVSMRRYFYSDHGKNYMLVGVPWSWIDSAPEGDLIIDPTTNAAMSEDVRLYDGGNYGSDTRLAVGKFQNTGNLKTRTLISFNLTGIPSDAIVLNAQMRLKYYEVIGSGGWVDRWVQAHQMLDSWNEAQADSLKRLTGVNWGAPRGQIGGTNPDANGQFESTQFFWQNEQQTELPKWKSWDLTALTQKWLNGTATNYGVILWATNEDVAGYTFRFHSSEATNQSDRPDLEVVYSTEATTRTVYFLKDHLGSIRATVLDSATAPVIGYDDYDPWGYPLALRTKAIPNAYLQGASKNKFVGMQLDDEYGLNWLHTPVRPYDGLMGRWVTMDPLALKYPSHSPYNYVGNNPLVMIDPYGTDWFYYQAEGEDESTWRYHEGKTATYTNTKGEKVTTKKGFEYLVKYTITGKNTAGAEIGTIQLYKQNELVLNATGVFTGGAGLKPIPEGNFMMRLDVRDSEGPQSIVFKPDGPNAAPHWGIQAIPNRYVEGYDVGGAYGTGRIRLNQVDENLIITPIQKDGYFYHGKLNSYNFTHGCACDRSQTLFNYFWSGAGKDYRGRAPFWVIKNR